MKKIVILFVIFVSSVRSEKAGRPIDLDQSSVIKRFSNDLKLIHFIYFAVTTPILIISNNYARLVF